MPSTVGGTAVQPYVTSVFVSGSGQFVGELDA